MCGGNYHDSEGYVTSPGYPSNYGNGLDCNYRVLGAGPSDYLTIDFDSGDVFGMEASGGGSCRYDYLQITDAATGEKVCFKTMFFLFESVIG